jgi:hypothetical protein
LFGNSLNPASLTTKSEEEKVYLEILSIMAFGNDAWYLNDALPGALNIFQFLSP